MYQFFSTSAPNDRLIAKESVSATNPSAQRRDPRARNRRSNGRPSSGSSITMGLACCRRAAMSCDLRDTRTGTGGRVCGGSAWT